MANNQARYTKAEGYVLLRTSQIINQIFSQFFLLQKDKNLSQKASMSLHAHTHTRAHTYWQCTVSCILTLVIYFGRWSPSVFSFCKEGLPVSCLLTFISTGTGANPRALTSLISVTWSSCGIESKD